MICEDFLTYFRCMGGFVDVWVYEWVASYQISKNLINLDLIEINQLSSKIYDLQTPPPMGGFVGGWMG